MKQQRGLTMIAWVILLAFLGINAVFALRIIPVYIDFYTVRSVMNELKSSPDVDADSSPREIKDTLKKRLKINSLYNLSDNVNDYFKLSKTKSGYLLKADIETRGPIYDTLDFVATYKYQVEITTRR